MEESLNNLKEWDLYHAYGQFNISYEKLIDRVRDCICELLHKYYHIKYEHRIHRNYSHHFEISDGVPESLLDRPFKLLLSEMTSGSVIHCFKGLLFELKGQNVLSFSDEEGKNIITLLCNKIIEANELRNKIIHSTSSIWSFPRIISSDSSKPLKKSDKVKDNNVSLFSKYEKVNKSGYDYQTANLIVSDFEKYNEHFNNLTNYVWHIMRFVRNGTLDIEIFEGLMEINLKPKHKSNND